MEVEAEVEGEAEVEPEGVKRPGARALAASPALARGHRLPSTRRSGPLMPWN